MKLSISNIAWRSQDDEKMYQVCKDMGFQGIEIAPSRIFGEEPYTKGKEAEEFRNWLKEKYGLNITSLQSIWYGQKGFLFKGDYLRLTDYTFDAVAFAGRLGADNIVFGCPQMRRIFKPEDYQKGNAFFTEVEKCAQKHDTVFSLEANPSVYGTNYMNDTLEAMGVALYVGKKHLKVNLDIGTMVFNEEPVELVEKNIHLIHHVHISEPYLEILKKRQIHKEIFRILKACRYEHYISIEMKCLESIEDVKRIMDYVAQLGQLY